MGKKKQLPPHVYLKGRINKYLYFEKRGGRPSSFRRKTQIIQIFMQSMQPSCVVNLQNVRLKQQQATANV